MSVFINCVIPYYLFKALTSSVSVKIVSSLSWEISLLSWDIHIICTGSSYIQYLTITLCFFTFKAVRWRFGFYEEKLSTKWIYCRTWIIFAICWFSFRVIIRGCGRWASVPTRNGHWRLAKMEHSASMTQTFATHKAKTLICCTPAVWTAFGTSGIHRCVHWRRRRPASPLLTTPRSICSLSMQIR